ncbi:HlyD family efflux transporter periplasmic adaptor subunit [Caproicibacter sp.]|uniref:HlyD family efflux transporter periplasmic adaptor subunit n=1 Tax=Caproicibacter sp. TaxID=2814884 RepID=UPI003989507B
MNNPLLRRLAASAIALLLLLYVGYQVYKSHYTGIQTETASYFTASDSVQVNGIAVRDEVPLKSSGGVIDYVLSSGDKVAKGGVVAKVYSSEQQVTALHKMASVDNEIKQLEELQSPGDTYAASPDSLNEQIHRKLSALLGQTVSGSLSSLNKTREDLLYLLNERQIITGKATDFSARLKELEAEHATLNQQAGTALSKIVSSDSGYFISSTDGFESAIDFSKVKTLTCDRIQAALSAKTASDSSIGKISRSYEWYFVFTVSPGQAAGFRQLADGGTVSLRFPFVSNVTVPASVAAVNQDGSDSPAAVILQCSNMNSELASIRKETAQVVEREYTGIRVSQKALHFETVTKKTKDEKGNVKTTKKEVSGVYVLHGSQLSFRQIVPLYSTDNYVICDPNPNMKALMTDETIKLHDEVVEEGTDLYDGKVVQ